MSIGFAITREQRAVLGHVASGEVWFDPRFYGVCGARADIVGALDELGLVAVDYTRDRGCHPRYPRHPIVLTSRGRVAIAARGGE